MMSASQTLQLSAVLLKLDFRGMTTGYLQSGFRQTLGPDVARGLGQPPSSCRELSQDSRASAARVS